MKDCIGGNGFEAVPTPGVPQLLKVAIWDTGDQSVRSVRERQDLVGSLYVKNPQKCTFRIFRIGSE